MASLAASGTGSCSVFTLTHRFCFRVWQSPAPARGGPRPTVPPGSSLHCPLLCPPAGAIALSSELPLWPVLGKWVAVGTRWSPGPQRWEVRGPVQGEDAVAQVPRGLTQLFWGGGRRTSVRRDNVQMGQRQEGGCLSAACGSWRRGGSGPDLLSWERVASAG